MVAALALWALLCISVVALVVIALSLCSLVWGSDKQLEALVHQLTAEQRIKQITDQTLQEMRAATKGVQY